MPGQRNIQQTYEMVHDETSQTRHCIPVPIDLRIPVTCSNLSSSNPTYGIDALFQAFVTRTEQQG